MAGFQTFGRGRISAFANKQVGFHVLVMMEGDLVRGVEATAFGAKTPVAIATRLTWKGYEFIDAAREPAVWDRAKALVARAGGSSFTVLMEALVKVALDRLGSVTP